MDFCPISKSTQKVSEFSAAGIDIYGFEQKQKRPDMIISELETTLNLLEEIGF